MKICNCAECNSVVPLSSTTQAEGKRFCIDCYTRIFDVNLTLCDKCHSLVSDKDIINEGYEQICVDCYNN